jgi:hypothetical protein
MLLQDVAAGRVVAMVVRTAELFGPWIKSKDSMLMVRDDARAHALVTHSLHCVSGLYVQRHHISWSVGPTSMLSPSVCLVARC